MDEWIPGESFTCISGNEIRQALLLAIWRDIQKQEPTGVLEEWKAAACTWPLVLRVVDKRSMLAECASLHQKRMAEAVEYTAPQQLQLLYHCVAQRRAESPEATYEELHIHCRRSDSVRRPGLKLRIKLTHALFSLTLSASRSWWISWMWSGRMPNAAVR